MEEEHRGQQQRRKKIFERKINMQVEVQKSVGWKGRDAGKEERGGEGEGRIGNGEEAVDMVI